MTNNSSSANRDFRFAKAYELMNQARRFEGKSVSLATTTRTHEIIDSINRRKGNSKIDMVVEQQTLENKKKQLDEFLKQFTNKIIK
jgi:hypothetical protein